MITNQSARHIIVMDSDGCVLDAMESKHRKAFIPAIFDTWPLADIYDLVHQTWIRINLYSSSRGVNRYLALSEFMHALQRNVPRGFKGILPDPTVLDGWIQSTTSLSEAGLLEGIQSSAGEAGKGLEQILNWTRLVNKNISWLPEPDLFHGALAVLEKAHAAAIPVYVVSSANRAAIEKEWKSAGIEPFIRKIFGQEDGTKVEILRQLAVSVSSPHSVLMIGDSPSDQDAARKSGTLFFPIVPKLEIQSWKNLLTEVLPEFQKNELTTDMLLAYLADFDRCLGGCKRNFT